MQEPATAPWGLSISDTDFKKLKAGFEPQDMDDKWRVLEVYVLVVKPSDGGSSSSIETITWEQSKGGLRISEEQAKKEAVSLTRGLLRCDFDALPE
ncbi:hypothetical protein BGW36DRAFT_463264 [Talaromyces proteolyticus]|uniref:Uncharacterized protein n=1 Tax=Talaromyces proteolyticus TaxID=1131652 RepID=A0AAD4KIW3_9EURO|nr:uncharacterized protein BGW36DRAFT_463264 [Talaromyces proteolyticus]KAH8693585.1 hypothetical protein BGW36DRAFT_463264 [Talaromyces proteolyticus]